MADKHYNAIFQTILDHASILELTSQKFGMLLGQLYSAIMSRYLSNQNISFEEA
jgi:hypothetical protein